MQKSRELHQARMKAQLDEWMAKVDLLKAKVALAAVGAKMEIHRGVIELRKLHQAGSEQLQELVSASAGAWKDVKVGVDEAWTEVESAVEATWDRLH
jgi:hypothetical protein